MKLFRFLSYNNAVPIAISVVLLGAGSAFAAGNPDAILASQQTVVTVDNTYIANKDLSTYTPRVEITGVTEDDDNYYVAYNFTTIDIQNYVWKDVMRIERMVISKKDLNGEDLGLYVTKRLHDVIDNERAYLAQVQEKERKAVTQQTIATTYSGLIGKFLDATTETLPGYTPVVQPPAPDASQSAAVVQSDAGAPATASPAQTVSTGPAAVALQVLGNNPALVALHSSYVDLGVVLLDPFGTNVGAHTFLDGIQTSSPNIDTSTSSVHIIEYRATDTAGNTAVARRIVLIGNASDPGGEISSSGTPVAPAAPVSAPTAAPVVPAPVTPAPTSASTSSADATTSVPAAATATSSTDATSSAPVTSNTASSTTQ